MQNHFRQNAFKEGVVDPQFYLMNKKKPDAALQIRLAGKIITCRLGFCRSARRFLALLARLQMLAALHAHETLFAFASGHACLSIEMFAGMGG